MGILFSDGFDSYLTSADLSKKWLTAQSPWVFNATGGRNGGGCVQAATTGGGLLKPVSSGFTTNVTVVYGFWLKVSAAPSALSTLLSTRSTAGTVLRQIKLTTAGKLACVNGNSGTPDFTGSVNVCDNNWHWIEDQIADTNLVVQKAYVDGLLEWNSIASGLAATAQDSFELTSVTGITISIDDCIAWDDSTGAPQLAALPLGPRQITTVRPQGDSAVAFATATGGSTHWDQLDEVAPDGDSTYVESSSSGDQDLYDFAALGISPANITAIVANAYVENPNPGVINFKQIAKASGTQLDGTSVQAPASYRNLQQSFPVDPSTSAAWASASAVDGAAFGVEVT